MPALKDFNSLLDVNKLAKIVSVANTPMYLFTHLRLNPSVFQFAKEFTTTEIISIFKNKLKRQDKNEEDLAIIYACIIALTFKRLEEVSSFLQQLHSYKLKWGDRLANIYFATVKIIDVESHTIPYNSSVIESNDSLDPDTQQNLIEIPSKE